MPTAKVKKTAGKKTQQCEQCYTVTQNLLDKEQFLFLHA